MLGSGFSGGKLALLHNDLLLVYLRDNFEDLPYPGLWDLPGGGREGEETAEECVLRELKEEFGLALHPSRIIWKRFYQDPVQPDTGRFFMVGNICEDEVSRIEFGPEGQSWMMMGVNDFVTRDDAVPHLQKRLLDFLSERHPPGKAASRGATRRFLSLG